jgi:hypothetical protein
MPASMEDEATTTSIDWDCGVWDLGPSGTENAKLVGLLSRLGGDFARVLGILRTKN